MRSWQSYMLNGVLRVISKRRMPLNPDMAKLRADNEKLDRKRFKIEPDTEMKRVEAGSVPAQWIHVPGSKDQRVILYLHGGGFVFRFPHAHSVMLARWCRLLSSRALLPDYRLAPEYPYPAAPDDCLATYRWLLDQAVNPGDIVIAGDSAGGCIALGILHGIREAGLPMPACAVLLSPGTDLTLSGASLVTNELKDPMFTLQSIITMRNAYARHDRMCEPAASPLFGDFAGFPPLQFIVGSTEMLLDDSRRAAEKAERAGIAVKLDVWEGMPHSFPMLPQLPETSRAIADIARFVGQHTNWDVTPGSGLPA